VTNKSQGRNLNGPISTQENERLLKQLEQSRSFSAATGSGNDKEVVKRLKKRELECQALWETLRDMKDH
jgi:hypothetical protein